MGKDAKAFLCFHPLLFHYHSSPVTLALPWLSSVNDVANQIQVLRLVLEFIPPHPIEYLYFRLSPAQDARRQGNGDLFERLELQYQATLAIPDKREMREVLRAADSEVDRMFMSVVPSYRGSDMGVSSTLCASTTSHPGPANLFLKRKRISQRSQALTKNANSSLFTLYPVTKFPSGSCTACCLLWPHPVADLCWALLESSSKSASAASSRDELSTSF
jgi:hypothetical protein